MNDDVLISYYPDTAQGHDLGNISFRNGCGSKIVHERVKVVVDADNIYFMKDTDGKGLRLNNNRIQLWTLAWIAKNWEGEYPLVYDGNKMCYKVRKEDRQIVETDTGRNLGRSVNYTPHYGEIAKRSDAPRNEVYEEFSPKVKEHKPTPAENTVLDILFGSLFASDNIDDVKGIARAIKCLLKGETA